MEFKVSCMPQAFQSYKPRHLRVYGAICINSSGFVLLVRGRKSQKWSFPKGHCKHNESDIECARRELFEETGLIAPETFLSSHKLRGGEYFIFPIEQSEPFLPIIQDSWEIEEVAWWPLHTLPEISNIDVSIFRTLMKHSKVEDPILQYINSPEAYTRVSSIKQTIQRSMTLPKEH